MSYIKKPSVVKIDPTVTHLQPDQFDNDDPIQDYPFGTSAMRVTTATGFPETSGDVITSRTTDDTGSQIFIGEKAYIRAFEGSVWSSWRELGESGSGPVEWDDILNKPSQFPPSPHTHDIEDIIGLQAVLDDKASAQSVNELQQEVDEHKAETTQNAHLAKNIGIEDTAGNFTATDVEGALSELFTSVSDGKDMIGGAITDVDPSIVIPPNPTFQDLANAISLLGGGGNGGIKSVQSGTITLQRYDQITDVSISSVDPSKSIVFIRVSANVGTPQADNLCVACEIIDDTTVRLERYDASQTYLPTVTWTVIEFDNVKSLQTGRQAGTANPTIVNINSVDVSKSALLFSHLVTAGSTSSGYFLTRGRISSPTTLEFIASATPSFHIYVWQVIEFE